MDSDDSFSQVSIGAYKLGTLIKVSNELLNDSVFNLNAYISKEFSRRFGNKEEYSFFMSMVLESHFYESRDDSIGGFFAYNTNASNNV